MQRFLEIDQLLKCWVKNVHDVIYFHGFENLHVKFSNSSELEGAKKYFGLHTLKSTSLLLILLDGYCNI